MISLQRVKKMKYECVNWEAIRNLRMENGYTQKQIADDLNVTQNTYSRYETGAANCPIDVLIKLADFYGVSVDYLLGRTSVKKPHPRE